MIDPVQATFSKSWNPRDNGTFGLNAAEVERIRIDLGALAQATFTKVLGDGGYPRAAEADAGVLRITAYIVNLYVTAPEAMQAGRSRTYVANAGQMTLVIELRDAFAGTLLAGAFDRMAVTDTGRLQWSNSVVNHAETETILRGWANRLKSGLDAAKAS